LFAILSSRTIIIGCYYFAPVAAAAAVLALIASWLSADLHKK